jgi:hypothetical protein
VRTLSRGMRIKDRIIELRRVKSSDLIPNAKNWRTHPTEQQNALKGVLSEVGFADAVLARETDEGLVLIDGHLRVETCPDQEIPVLVLDVTEQEADMILATLDPLAAMAETNKNALEALLSEVSSKSEAVNAMLSELKIDAGLIPVEGKEFDESIADDVHLTTCPNCGHEF